MATARLRLMRVSSAGAFSKKEGATTNFAPLISTTGDSMLIEARDVLGRPNPNEFLEKFKPGGKPLIIAARVSGSTNSAFPDGEPQPPPEPGSEGKIAVSLWLGRDRRAAKPVVREVA